MSTKRGVKRAALPLAACLTLHGCALPERVGYELSTRDREYPVLNDKPIRFVDITGEVPPQIFFKMTASYSAEDIKGCRYSPTATGRMVEGVEFPISIEIPLQLNRADKSFTATLTVDLFKKGKCNWQFSHVSFHPEKEGIKSIGASVLVAPERISRRSLEHFESKRLYWDDSPVLLNCKFSQISAWVRKGGGAAACLNAADNNTGPGKILSKDRSTLHVRVTDADSH